MWNPRHMHNITSVKWTPEAYTPKSFLDIFLFLTLPHVFVKPLSILFSHFIPRLCQASSISLHRKGKTHFFFPLLAVVLVVTGGVCGGLQRRLWWLVEARRSGEGSVKKGSVILVVLIM
ncbi:hypothetical protein V8G54_034938 [Vigna mungo]|uniref:Uncharacterized protein n=1 Tax=Vigna mungo TaxID=3915 RepID=A0AAQ3ME27_VIGMU